MLSRMMRSGIGYLLVLGLPWLAAGCSSVAPDQQSAEIERKLPYSCRASADGQSWQCSGDSAPVDQGPLTEPLLPADKDAPLEVPDSLDRQSEEDRLDRVDETAQSVVPAALKDQVADIQGPREPAIEKLYSVQIGAFAGERQRDEFVAANRLPKSLFAYREAISDGRTWWVLTYGEYEDMSASNAAMVELQDQFGLRDTWVRPLSQFDSSSALPADEVAPEKDADHPDYYYPLYAIQLAAFKTEQQRIRFVDEKGLAALNPVLVEEQRDGIRWWILLYGEFESVQAAKIEQQQIASNYGLVGTWIKPLDD